MRTSPGESASSSAAPRPDLFLFDIDRTLIESAGPPLESKSIMAIRNLYGLDIHNDDVFSGYTDPLIFKALLEGVGWDAGRITAALPALLVELEHIYDTLFDPSEVQIIPGVLELLEALRAEGCVRGLITGNIEPVAKLKLAAVGIWDFFSVGGYGSDPHSARSDLVTIAIAKAGYDTAMEKVYVLGDTERDIEAARAAQVQNSVGVVNGFGDEAELAAAKPAILLEDFTDTTAVLEAFGVLPKP
jgi:phosphoglycolate phosphatase